MKKLAPHAKEIAFHLLCCVVLGWGTAVVASPLHVLGRAGCRLPVVRLLARPSALFPMIHKDRPSLSFRSAQPTAAFAAVCAPTLQILHPCSPAGFGVALGNAGTGSAFLNTALDLQGGQMVEEFHLLSRSLSRHCADEAQEAGVYKKAASSVPHVNVITCDGHGDFSFISMQYRDNLPSKDHEMFQLASFTHRNFSRLIQESALEMRVDLKAMFERLKRFDTLVLSNENNPAQQSVIQSIDVSLAPSLGAREVVPSAKVVSFALNRFSKELAELKTAQDRFLFAFKDDSFQQGAQKALPYRTIPCHPNVWGPRESVSFRMYSNLFQAMNIERSTECPPLSIDPDLVAYVKEIILDQVLTQDQDKSVNVAHALCYEMLEHYAADDQLAGGAPVSPELVGRATQTLLATNCFNMFQARTLVLECLGNLWKTPSGC